MSKTKISLDNQIFLSKQKENMGISNHYVILLKQLHELQEQFNIGVPIFVERGKNLDFRSLVTSFLATYIRKVNPRIYWAIARREAKVRGKKSDFIFTSFYYSTWFDIYSEQDLLSRMIVCNHDCIIENLAGRKLQISSEGQSKEEFLFASKAVYVPSKWTFENTVYHYPRVKDKLFLMPHYIDFSPAGVRDAVDMRFQRPIIVGTEKRLSFLHVGSADSYKNFNLVYEMLLESKFQVDLILLGCNILPMLDQVRRLRSIGHNVRVYPYATEEEKSRLYREADVLLMPSLDEGFSFPTYEAAVAGLPIVKYSKNSWGFSGLTVTSVFKVGTILKSLRNHYEFNRPSEISTKIIEELHLNNQLSVSGLKQLINFVLETK